jgi:hypothetical protein
MPFPSQDSQPVLRLDLIKELGAGIPQLRKDLAACKENEEALRQSIAESDETITALKMQVAAQENVHNIKYQSQIKELQDLKAQLMAERQQASELKIFLKV